MSTVLDNALGLREIIDCYLLFALKFDHIFKHREKKMHSCTHHHTQYGLV